jgi:hypothetical protein
MGKGDMYDMSNSLAPRAKILRLGWCTTTVSCLLFVLRIVG